MTNTSKFYTGKSCNAFKMFGKCKQVATWKSDEPGLLFLNSYDKNGIYEPTGSWIMDLHNNADMFEYLEREGFLFVE